MTVSIDLSTTRLAQVRHELGRVIVGQDRVVDRLLVAVLADGHVLLEGAPGLGKTLLLATLARILGGSFNRIQFTPDLIPSDIVGTRIFRPSSEVVRRRARADPGQPGAGRRDQPRPRAGPVGAARGDGGAAGHGRRSHLPDAAAVPGRGHPEPGRVGGRLSARRGAARSVPDADPGRLPDPGRGTGDRRPDGRRAAPGGAPARCGRRGRPSDRGPAGRGRRGSGRLRHPPGARDPRSRGPRAAEAGGPPRVRRQPTSIAGAGPERAGHGAAARTRACRAAGRLRRRVRHPQRAPGAVLPGAGRGVHDRRRPRRAAHDGPGSRFGRVAAGDRGIRRAGAARRRAQPASPTEPMLAVSTPSTAPAEAPPIVLPGDPSAAR